MPWQQQVLDVALEIDPETGKLVYREVILTVPRQSGKTTLILVLVLLRALMEQRQQVRYTAQTGSDARKKLLDDWLPILKPSKFGNLFHPRLTNGHEALIFKNGSHCGLIATTQKSGHGTSLDLAILDEAFAHPDARLEQAVKPAMITRPQPQLWIVSTAGTPDLSPYLLDKVDKGRLLVDGGVNDKVAYFEWSPAEDADPADPATWWSCMPALGYTVTEEAVAADFASMELSEFERAYLNRWKSTVRAPVIPVARWLALADPTSSMEDPITLAFDVTPDHSSASIVAAGIRADGRKHVEVITSARGATWVPQRLAELVAAHNVSSVICDGRGPASSLLPAVAAAGIEPFCVNSSEHGQACGLIYDAVDDGSLVHLGQLELTTAIDGAVKRPLGDAWAWNRKSSSIDISPLVAATLALWGTQTQTKPAPSVWDLNDVLADMQNREKAPA